MTKLECLLCAIWEYNKSRLPEDVGFRANNPLRLGKYLNGVATGELRKYSSLHAGLVSGLTDLQIKCSGKSRAKLQGEDFTIKGLIRVYSLPDGTAHYVAKFLKRALDDESIKPETKLDYFVDKPLTKEFLEQQRYARPTDTNRS